MGGTFKENKSDYGGAIYNEGSLKIESATFSKNSGTNAGAIYNKNNKMIINGSDEKPVVFKENYSSGDGGAIESIGSCTSEINHATFVSNYIQQKSGGAIYYGGNSTNIIKNSTFSYNNAPYLGGAMYFTGGSSTIDNCNINHCESSGDGGGIYCSSFTKISNSVIEECKAQNGGGFYAGTTAVISNTTFNKNVGTKVAGAVCSTAKLTIEGGSKFTNNSANEHGGALMSNNVLYIDGASFNMVEFSGNVSALGGAVSLYTGCQPVLNYAKFTENNALVYRGGAIYTVVNTTINSCNFNSNTANESGGGVFCDGDSTTQSYVGSLDINNTTLDSNTATSGYGGGICSLCRIKFTGGKIINNKARESGGGLHYQFDYGINIENSEISNNEVSKGIGGGISAAYSDITMKNCTLSGNKASASSSAAIVTKGSYYIYSCNFTENYSLYYAGVFFVEANKRADVYDSTFEKNSSTQSGGALCNNSGTLNITRSTFKQNESSSAGAIWSSGTLVISGSKITSNNAGNTSGAIFASGYTKISSIDGIKSEISSNSAEQGAGAIHTSGNNTTEIYDAVFSENTANNDGAAIYNDANLVLSGCQFNKNICKSGSGGAIMNTSSCSVNSSTFTTNSSASGGGICNVGELSFGSSKTIFDGNIAYLDGGAVAQESEKLVNFANTEFKNNIAYEYGGAIYASKSFSLTNSTFTSNIANIHGGAVYDVTEDNINVSSCNFSSNEAVNGNGGGYFAFYSKTFTNDTFDGNKAGNYGGAIISFSDGDIVFNGGSISNNNSKVYGGGIYCTGALKINQTGGLSTTVSNNSSAQGGGILIYSDYPSAISNADISSNKALSGNGGGFYAIGDLSIVNSTLNNNSCTDSGAVILSMGLLELTSSISNNNQAGKDGGVGILYGTSIIKDCHASANTCGKYGSAYSNVGTTSIIGGSIKNNVGKHAVFSYDNSQRIEVGGSLVLQDNYYSISNEDIVDNLYLASRQYLGISQTYPLSDGAQIGVYTARRGTVIDVTEKYNDNVKDPSYLVSDKKGFKSKELDSGSQHYIVFYYDSPDHKHCLCGDKSCTESSPHEIVSYSPWTESGLPDVAGDYYLTNDVVISNPWSPVDGIRLCLNGHSITQVTEGKSVIQVVNGATFTLCDCAATSGKITHKEGCTGRGIDVAQGTFNFFGGTISENAFSSDSTQGAGVLVYREGVFNQYGGNISNNGSDSSALRTYGGGVYLANGSHFNMHDGTIASNKCSANGGGILCVNGANLNILGGTISNNKATLGGGIYTLCDCTISNCAVSENSSTSYGAGICGYGSDGNLTKVELDNVTLESNQSPSYGAAIYSAFSQFTLENCVLKSNKASKQGAGVYVDQYTPITIKNSDFSLNEAESGGALAFKYDASISNSSFTGNKAETKGAAILNNYGTLEMSSSSLSENSCSDDEGNGAALYNKGESKLDDCKIFNNSVNSIGGGIYNGATLEVENSKIYSNESLKSSGGGIACFTDSSTNVTTKITSSEINDNYAANGSGGGIYNYSSESGQTMINCDGVDVFNNTSRAGAGIANIGTFACSVLEFKNGKISNNIAQEYSGGLYNTGTTSLYDSEINTNSASKLNAGILSEGTTSVLEFGGADKINENTIENSSVDSNILLKNGAEIILSTTMPLSEESQFGVALYKDGVGYCKGNVTTPNTTEMKKHFVSECKYYEVLTGQNNRVILDNISGVCELYEGDTATGTKLGEFSTINAAVAKANLDTSQSKSFTIRMLKELYSDSETVFSAASSSVKHSFTLDLNDKIIYGDFVPQSAKGIFVVNDSVNVSVNDFSENKESQIINGKVRAFYNLGNLTLSSGKISNNSADYGAAIYNKATFKMTGGTISNNNATACGSAIYNFGNATLIGGKISDNNGKYAIYTDENCFACFTLGGNFVIKGNYYKDGAKSYDSNFVLNKGQKFKVSTESPFVSDAEVHVLALQDGNLVEISENYSNDNDATGPIISDDNYRSVYNRVKSETSHSVALHALYKIDFDSQSSADNPDTQYVYPEDLIEEPDYMYSSGYAFMGWFTESECVNRWDFASDTPQQDMTLYAKWVPAIQLSDLVYTAPSPLLYDAKEKVATVAVSDPEKAKKVGNITVKYFDSDDNELTNPPINVGTYQVKVDIEGTETYGPLYNLTSPDWVFSITARDVVITTEGGEKTYDGNPLVNDKYSITGDGFIDEEKPDITNIGSQLDVGSTDNECSVAWHTESQQHNYNISFVVGKLTVNYREVEVTVDDSIKALGESDPQYSSTVNNRIDDTFNFNFVYSRTEGEDIGDYEVSVSGETIQGNYKVVKFTNGKLTIVSKAYIVTFDTNGGPDIDADYQKVYEGNKVEDLGYIAKENKVIYGWFRDKECTDQWNFDTDIPTSDITLYAKWKDCAQPENFVYDSGQNTFPYDGKPHGATLTPDSGMGSMHYHYRNTKGEQLEGEPIDAGIYLIVVDVDDGDAFGKTYNITEDSETWIVTITKRDLTVWSKDCSYAYNAKPQTYHEYDTEGLQNDENITLSFTGSQTDAGGETGNNKYDILWKGESETSTANKDNYNLVEQKFGTITVNPVHLKITTDGTPSDNIPEYDGKDHKVKTGAIQIKLSDGTYSDPIKTDEQGNVTINYDVTQGLYEVLVLNTTGSQINAGSSSNTYTFIWGTEEHSGKQINYVFDAEQDTLGKLVVNKKELQIYTDDYTGVYDAATHTADGRIVGVAEGESLTFNTTGKQKDAGSSINEYDLSWDGSANKDNYSLKDENIHKGNITITSFPVTVQANSAVKLLNSQDPELTVTVSNKPDDNFELVYSVQRQEGEALGDYQITVTGDKYQGGAESKNYEITYKSNTFTITDKYITVTFEMNGHGSQVDPQQVLYNDYVKEPQPEPEEKGQAFAGWYKQTGEKWDFATDKASNTDITLYAKWTEDYEKAKDPYAGDISYGINGDDSLNVGDKTSAVYSDALNKIDGETASTQTYSYRQDSIALARPYVGESESEAKKAATFSNIKTDTYFDETLLDSNDYDIKDVTIYAPTVLDYHKFTQDGKGYTDSFKEQDISAGEWAYSAINQKAPSMILYAKTSNSQEWIKYADIEFTEAGVPIITPAKGVTVKDNVVTLPIGLECYKLETSFECDGLIINSEFSVNLQMNDKVKKIANELTNSKDTPSGDLKQGTQSQLTENGKTAPSKIGNDDGICILKGIVYGYDSESLNASVSSSSGQSVITVEPKIRLQSTINDEDVYLSAITKGSIPKETSGTLWYLLPVGAQFNANSIICDQGISVSSIDQISNFRNTGQTMVKLAINADFKYKYFKYQSSPINKGGWGQEIDVKFSFCISDATVSDFGNEIYGRFAYESSNYSLGLMQNHHGEPDNPNGNRNISSKIAMEGYEDIFSNLNPSRTDAYSFVYGKNYSKLEQKTETSDSYSLKVANNTSEYSETTDVNSLQGYSYRMRCFAANADKSNLIFYDALEEKKISGKNNWKGKLKSIDVSQLYSLGCLPVVYYSTVPGLKLSDSGSSNLDLSDSSIWTTTPPFDLSSVTAIAVDATKNKSNENFVLSKGRGASVIVNMSAPSWTDKMGYAINEASCKYKHVDGGFGFDISSITQATCNKTNYLIQSVWNDDYDIARARPESLEATLWVNGKATSVKATLSTQNEYTCDITQQIYDSGIELVDEFGHDAKLLIVSNLASNYTTYTSVDFGSKTIIKQNNTYSPTYYSVTGDISWEDNNNNNNTRPDKVTLELWGKMPDESSTLLDKISVVPDAKGQWSFSFGEQDLFYGQSKLECFLEQSYVDGYKASYSIDVSELTKEIYCHVVDTYNPLGDLEINVNKAEGVTEVSEAIPMIVGFKYSDETIVDTNEYDYDIVSDGEIKSSGKITAGKNISVPQGATLKIHNLPSDKSVYAFTEPANTFYSKISNKSEDKIIEAGISTIVDFDYYHRSESSFSPNVTLKINGTTLEYQKFSVDFVKTTESGDEIIGSAINKITHTSEDVLSFNHGINISNSDCDESGKGTFDCYCLQVVPYDAVNGEGIQYQDASEEQKEAGGFVKDGVTYDSKKYKFELKYYEDNAGVIKFEDVDPIVTTNSYFAEGTASPFAWVSLAGGALVGDDFDFQLKGESTTFTKKNNSDGFIQFDDIKFTSDDIGTEHKYSLSQVIPDDAVNKNGKKYSEASEAEKLAGGFALNGIEYDSTIFTVTIELIDRNQGYINCSVIVKDSAGNIVNPVFCPKGIDSLMLENKISTSSATGYSLSDQFEYEISLEDEFGNPVEGSFEFTHGQISSNANNNVESADSQEESSEQDNNYEGYANKDTEQKAAEDTEEVVQNDDESDPTLIDNADPQTFDASDDQEFSNADNAEENTYEQSDHIAYANDYTNEVSGTCGTCKWTISDEVLTIEPQTGASGTLDEGGTTTNPWPWTQYIKQGSSVSVKKAVINSTVYTKYESAAYMFSDAYESTEVQTTIESVDLSGLKFPSSSSYSNISCMFYNCTQLNSVVFPEAGFGVPISLMTGLFCKCKNLKEVDFKQATSTTHPTCRSCFSDCENIEKIDFGQIQVNYTSSIGTYQYELHYTFQNCYKLQTITWPNFTKIDFAYGIESTFENCYSLENVDFMKNINFDTRYNRGIALKNIFKNCKKITSFDFLTTWNCPNITSMESTFEGCESATKIDLTKFSFYTSVTTVSLANLFNGCSSATSIVFGTDWNTTYVNNMENMFKGCSSITSFNFAGTWNTSNVTTMAGMFQNCSSVTSLSLSSSNWNTAALTTTENMFNGCTNLSSVSFGSNFTVNKATILQSMFESCSSLTSIDISNFDNSAAGTSRWIYCYYRMFANCSNLQTLNISKINNRTDSVYWPKEMFLNCSAIDKITIGSNFRFANNSGLEKDGYLWTCSNYPSAKWDTATFISKINDSSSYAGTWIATEAPKEATLSFSPDKQGAIGSVGSITVTPEMSSVILPRADYYLFDWHITNWKDKSTGTLYKSDGTQEIAQPLGGWTDTEYIAVWEQDSHTAQFTEGKAIIKLQANETALFDRLPKGMRYTVKQVGANSGWSVESKVGDSGVIGGSSNSNNNDDISNSNNECITTNETVYDHTNNSNIVQDVLDLLFKRSLNSANDRSTASFVDLYTIDSTSFTPYATVDLTYTVGETKTKVPLSGGEYTFSLIGSDGSTLQEVKNSADGNINFDPIKLTPSTSESTATYNYKIKQNGTSEGLDTSIYSLEVNLQKVNSAWKVVSTKITKDSSTTELQSIDFHNTCDAPETKTGSIKINESVQGITESDKDFTYKATLSYPNKTFKTETFTIKDKASKIFDNLPVGTTWVIEEDQAARPYGYKLTSASQFRGSVTEDQTEVNFTHKFSADSLNVSLKAAKKYYGAPLYQSMFNYKVVEADNPEKILAQATNNSLGDISFDYLINKPKGTFTYYICEVVPEDAINSSGIAYKNADYETKAKGGFVYGGVEYGAPFVKVDVVVDEQATTGQAFISKIIYTEDETSNAAIFSNKAVPGSLHIAFASENETELSKGQNLESTIKFVKADGSPMGGSICWSKTDTEATELSTTETGTSALNNGAATLQSVAGKTFTITDLPAGTMWNVTSTPNSGGYVHLSTSMEQGTISSSDVKPTADTSTITWQYEVSGSWIPTAKKTLDGGNPSNNEFLFSLEDAESGVEQESAYCNDNGDIVFGDIVYNLSDAGKTFTYNMVEKDQGREDIIYDPSIKEIKVSVSDTGTGSLNVDPSYPEDMSFDNISFKDGSLVIENKVNPLEGCSVKPSRTGEAPFSYTVSFKKDGAELTDEYEWVSSDGRTGLIKSGGDLFAVAGGNIRVNDLPEGTEYTVKQMESLPKGYTAQEEAKTQHTGTIKSLKKSKEIFTNDYKPLSFDVKLIGASKIINGDQRPDNQLRNFSIKLISIDGSPLPPGSTGTEAIKEITDQGSFDTFGNVTFDKVGTYSYKVVEQKMSESEYPGYTFDESEYSVVYQVIDNWGELSASVTISKGGSEASSIEFVNTYTVKQIKTAIPIVKNTIEGTTKADMFKFALSSIDGAPLPPPDENGPISSVVSILGTASKSYNEITYTKAGKYAYTINEINEGLDGYVYDSTVYDLIVDVTDTNAELSATWTLNKKNDTLSEGLNSSGAYNEFNETQDETMLARDNSLTEASFVTKYYTEAKVTPSVVKNLSGPDRVDSHNFSFKLERMYSYCPLPQGTEGVVATTTLEMAKDLSSATVDFNNIDFLYPGSYSYKISEIEGSDKYIEYDTTSTYNLTYTVSEDAGTIVATPTITDKDGQVVSEMVFNNTYNPASHVVDFDNKGIGTKPSSQTVVYGGKVTDPGPIEREKYNFAGWYITGEGEHKWDFDNDVMPDKDITLEARWNEKDYHKVTFDTMGHGVAPAQQTVMEGELVSKPADPTEQGYSFEGWYKDNQLSTSWDFDNDRMGTSDMVLYAKWTPLTNTKYTVKHWKLDINGSRGSMPDDIEYLTGTTGELTNAQAKNYDGYEPKSFEQKNIAGDGSTVIDIEYSIAPDEPEPYNPGPSDEDYGHNSSTTSDNSVPLAVPVLALFLGIIGLCFVRRKNA